MIDALWRDALLAVVAIAVLGYLGSVLAGGQVPLRPVALFLGLSFAALAAVGYDRVRAAAELYGEGYATWLATREAIVALAIVLFVVLARLATGRGPPPAHVDPGFFWLTVGLTSGVLLLAVGASVRREMGDR